MIGDDEQDRDEYERIIDVVLHVLVLVVIFAIVAIIISEGIRTWLG